MNVPRPLDLSRSVKDVIHAAAKAGMRDLSGMCIERVKRRAASLLLDWAGCCLLM